MILIFVNVFSFSKVLRGKKKKKTLEMNIRFGLDILDIAKKMTFVFKYYRNSHSFGLKNI